MQTWGLKINKYYGEQVHTKLCKLNPIPVCQGAGKFRFFHCKNIPSNTYKVIDFNLMISIICHTEEYIARTQIETEIYEYFIF